MKGNLCRIRDAGSRAAWLLLLMLFAFPVSAQETTSTLSGVVADQTGAVVPGVEIIVISDDTGWERKARTNTRGIYVLPLLAAGRYTLTAKLEGFAQVTINNLLVRVSRDAAVNITLRPGALTENIVVEASADPLELLGATRSVSVTSRQVVALPVFSSPTGRNVLNFVPFLVAGVTPANVLGGLVPSGRDARGEGLSVNGGRGISISYNLDGGDNNDGELGIAASVLPNPDALQEFTVITNNYQADLGRSAAGVVNAVVRRGTGEFHGNVRYFRLDERFNARSFFESFPSRDRLNTIGAQLGGPLYPKRTFFFVDYEGNRSKGLSQRRESVAPLAWRAGNFQSLAPSLQLIDPLTGTPFLDNIIPGDRIDPVAGGLFSLLPAPTMGETGFTFFDKRDLSLDQITFRGDHEFSPHASLSVTYFLSNTDSTVSSFGAPLGSTLEGGGDARNVVVRQTHIISDTALNQITGAIAFRDDLSVTHFGQADGQPPSSFGFQIFPQTNQFLGLPTISFVSVSLPVGNFDRSRVRNQSTWQVKDDFSLVRGSHMVRLGGELRQFRMTSVLGNDNGTLSYLGAVNCCGTGHDFADFLLGVVPDTFSQFSGNTLQPRQTAVAFYLLDEWRWRQDMTFNAGLRYEIVPPLRDQTNQISVFRPGAQSQVFPLAPLGLLFFGDDDPVLGRVPRGVYPLDKNNLSPRLGLSYSPRPRSGGLRTLFGEGRTAIRLGAGLFYDHTYGRTFTEFQQVQPFSVLEFLPSTLAGPAGGTLANPFGTLPNNWPLDLNERSFLGAPVVQSFDPKFRTAYSYQFNITMQRALPAALFLEVAYVGSRGFRLNRERERNPGGVGPGATTSNIEERRFHPQFSSIPIQESTGESRYDSLQLRLRRKGLARLTFDLAYTFGKSFDDSSSPLGAGTRFVQGTGVSTTFPLLWARSGFDRRHNFVASYTYQFPKTGHGGVRAFFFNGWGVSGVTQLRTGLPLDIAQAIDSTLTGEANQGRPDLTGPFQSFNPRREQILNGQTGNFFFNPEGFQPVVVNDDYTEARRGTLGRNIFSGPGQNLTSLSLIKLTRLTDRQSFELRADFNNVFNHANFTQPETLIDRSTFGQVTAAAPGRRIQLSVRYSF